MQESLVASCPDVPRYAYRLVRALITGLPDGAEPDEHAAQRARARDLAEALHRDHPEAADFAKVLADVLILDGVAAREHGDRDAARRAFLQAARITAAAATRDPANIELRDAHAQAALCAAEEAAFQDDGARALDLLERGLEGLRLGLRREPRQPTRRRFMRQLLDLRVRVQAVLGQHAAAASTLAERAEYCDDAPDCYAVAVVAALVARTATATTRTTLVERGLLLLQDGIRRGFTDAARLDADPDLAELRADPRFAELRRAMATR